MIHEPHRLAELIDEVIEKPLEWRRAYIDAMEKAFGPSAAQQIKDALTQRWQKR